MLNSTNISIQVSLWVYGCIGYLTCIYRGLIYNQIHSMVLSETSCCNNGVVLLSEFNFASFGS